MNKITFFIIFLVASCGHNYPKLFNHDSTHIDIIDSSGIIICDKAKVHSVIHSNSHFDSVVNRTIETLGTHANVHVIVFTGDSTPIKRDTTYKDTIIAKDSMYVTAIISYKYKWDNTGPEEGDAWEIWKFVYYKGRRVKRILIDSIATE